jgi:predicted transcriptional regulator
MSIIEMKKELIEKIQSTDDEMLLEEIYRLLEINLDEDYVIELTESQNEMINAGIKDIKEGNFLTHEQANKEIDEWLGR